jgi:predicted TIM-barrel fold metal-dependent hydrolase
MALNLRGFLELELPEDAKRRIVQDNALKLWA